ncbi:MAG TPA: aquaporin [Chloroflexota bacterium]|nr:aquaporin [Chloroflexota bacterium]
MTSMRAETSGDPNKAAARDPYADPALQGRQAALQSGRRLLAELIGTFALTFVAAGGGVIAAISGGTPNEAARVVAPALLVMAMIYSVGPVSGAHFNPAVTLAFAARGDFPWSRVPGYWIVQLAGAVGAAAVLRLLFGTAGHLGATLPRHGTGASLVMEIILTFLLVTVILATAANFKIVGHNAALAVAGTIALDGLFAAPISGASMNPARSLGPALVGGSLDSVWIYIVGPMVGALAAVAFAWLFRGPHSTYGVRAATGEQ